MKQFLNLIPTPTWKRLIIYCVSFIGVFFISIAIDFACGPEIDPYDYYVSFFHNNVGGGKSYEPFYFTSYEFLYDDTEPLNEHDINTYEWKRYLNKNVRYRDINKAMYLFDEKANEALPVFFAGNKANTPDSLKKNTFLKALTKNKSALNYFLFAKSIEPFGTGERDDWKTNHVDPAAIYRAGIDALKRSLKVHDGFIKLRYCYQAQRLLRYSGHLTESNEVYAKHIVNDPSDSHVKGWALALKAGEEFILRDTVQAAYLFSKVFSNYPERRVQAYINYTWCKAPLNKVLSLAANPNEKVNIYAIHGFHTPQIDSSHIKKIYAIKPASPFLWMLLAREINKVEEGYVKKKLNRHLPYYHDNHIYYYNEPKTTHNQYIKQIYFLKKFCALIADEGKCREPALGYIAKAYLDWMTDDNEAGFAALANAEKEKLNLRVNNQARMVELLLVSQKIKKMNAVPEKKLLPLLTWLDKKVGEEIRNGGEQIKSSYWEGEHLMRFKLSARDFYQKILTPAYLKQHDTTKAALAMLKSDPQLTGDTLRSYHISYWSDFSVIDFWQNYMHSANLKKVFAYKKGLADDHYLRFLSSGLKDITRNDLYNLLGTAYLREHNYSMAAKTLSKIKNYGKKDFPFDDDASLADINPFIDQLNDYPKIFNNGKGECSKLTFAKRMYHIQKEIKADPKNSSKYYFEMATGLYNTSHYGNAWSMISYTWSNEDYGRGLRYYYDADFVKTANAQKYYLKARQLSTNDEFKAKCTFMAAKCWQKHIPIPNGFEIGDTDDKYDKAVRSNQYFKELQKGYSKTAFYTLAVSDCSYLRDFLKDSKK